MLAFKDKLADATTNGGSAATAAPSVKPIVGRIQVAALDLWVVQLRIRGESDLVTCALSPEALENPSLIFDEKPGATPKSKTKKVARSEDAFQHAIYRTTDGRPGFPAAGILRCVADATEFNPDTYPHYVRGLLRIPMGIVPIEGSEPKVQKAGVRNKHIRGGGAVVANRALFPVPWHMDVFVVYRADRIAEPSLETVVNLFREGGFHNGLGVHRQQCNGTNGQFDIEVLSPPAPYNRYGEKAYQFVAKGE